MRSLVFTASTGALPATTATDGDDLVTGTPDADTLLGGAGDDTLDGLDGDDRLIGGSGADLLRGGGGNDVYVVDAAGDVVFESAGPAGGFDTVRSAVSFVLGANIEQLVLTGTAAIRGDGNALANTLVGNGAANVLRGAAGHDNLFGAAGRDLLLGGLGDDTLRGGAGADTLRGGAGDDTYLVDTPTDVLAERAGEGFDIVTATVSWTLGANFESLFLAGTRAVDGTGNEAANRIVGNDSANVLRGQGGHDTLEGGGGDDLIAGGEGHDDLTGGSGADTLEGGEGSDTYRIDGLDTVVESGTSSRDVDTVVTTASFRLGPRLENLQLSVHAAPDSVATGNGLANLITGNDRPNTLVGGAGDDTLQGGLGSDLLVGGPGADQLDGGDGNDTYANVDALDSVIEPAGSGDDLVTTSLGSYTLGLHVERLAYVGRGDFSGTGNLLANVLTGGAGHDTLRGEAGGDQLLGGAGDDLLQGGEGNDTLVGGGGRDQLEGGAGADRFLIDFTAAGHDDRIAGFESGADQLAFDMSAMEIGDGDLAIDGGVATGARWNPGAELVIDTGPLAGLDIETVGAGFSSASGPVPSGARKILVAHATGTSDPGTGVYLFVSADGDADVEASELVLLAVLTGTATVVPGDFVFVA